MSVSTLENQITKAVEELGESVVSISSKKLVGNFFFGFMPVEGSGSGVIIDGGYIVTNYHVVDNAERVQISLKDGRTLVGEVIGADQQTDIALVKVDAGNLTPAKLGDSERLKVGQMALAIGNTLGLPGGPTVSTGVISALGRPLPGTDFIFEGLVQTDAAINPGNSGGPLADLNGNVIGINTAMIPFAQGIGFAIPINTIKWVVAEILKNGRVARPWLGISGMNLTAPVRKRFNIEAESGVLIAEGVQGSPAHEAGLQEGDVLTEVGPHKVKSMKDLLAALSKLRIGEKVAISFIRMGAKYKTSLRLVEAPVRNN